MQAVGSLPGGREGQLALSGCRSSTAVPESLKKHPSTIISWSPAPGYRRKEARSGEKLQRGTDAAFAGKTMTLDLPAFPDNVLVTVCGKAAADCCPEKHRRKKEKTETRVFGSCPFVIQLMHFCVNASWLARQFLLRIQHWAWVHRDESLLVS